MKVMTILGTRPEIIRLSRVIARLDEACEHVLVHTGQSHDRTLSDVFFEDLGLRAPDHHLDVKSDSLGAQLGNILAGAERVLTAERPDALVVLGDTNSALSAIMAKRMRVPVYHMEAGNRCFDWNVPEEINRRMIDHIADVNLVYTEHARRNLIAEGLPARRIALTGSPMREVLEHYADRIEASDVLSRLEIAPRDYLVASVHREETVDNPAHLSKVAETLTRLSETFERPVLVSTHPRLKRRLEEAGGTEIGGNDIGGVRFHEPFGLLDYVKLQKNAFCTISDSGTLSEEAAMLGFPAVSLRNATERPEGVEAGAMLLTGIDAQTVVDAVSWQTARFAAGERPVCPPDYTIADTSARVVSLVLGTAGLMHRWVGIDPRPS
ncbi:non-hydrolyzing UDP-N-acetylglucosamine 2-epimerase [Microbaculum marinisediminis]|uniref:UDP-N-acetylglucosamine 2-epimerase (Non-hydrolyzing) n=1 Tax=Microbaculum marinisediminis TaxID=2931392 RepID=A0AAW5R388_9HYPH|nr:UDP-N-acetylglucosamine 2-epimerase (non-hydrolyzing) [Microbaculum sp. A6E488]MCT8974741.1 UDP-N-acetylglucosamine 2-epimerase (non-hydrolyzing) [Microbaculum sp. A6E488]